MFFKTPSTGVLAGHLWHHRRLMPLLYYAGIQTGCLCCLSDTYICISVCVRVCVSVSVCVSHKYKPKWSKEVWLHHASAFLHLIRGKIYGAAASIMLHTLFAWLDVPLPTTFLSWTYLITPSFPSITHSCDKMFTVVRHPAVWDGLSYKRQAVVYNIFLLSSCNASCICLISLVIDLGFVAWK